MLAFSKPKIAQKLKAKAGGAILNVLASKALHSRFFLSSSKALINNQVRHRPDIEQRHSRIIAGEIAGTDVINRILPLVLAVLEMYHRQSGQEQTLGQLPIVDRLRTMGPEA
jgi:hypothetical protein